MFVERDGASPLWIAFRSSPNDPWSAPSVWSDGTAGDRSPSLVHDGSAVYFVRNMAIHRAVRTAPGTYAAAAPIAWADVPPSSPIAPVVTADERTLYFGSTTTGPYDVWIARRASASDVWGAPEKVSEVSTAFADWPTWVSADGCELWVTSNGAFGDAGSSKAFDPWAARRGN
jgi:hypothetical protein